MTRLLVSARPGPYLSRCTAAGSRHCAAATSRVDGLQRMSGRMLFPQRETPSPSCRRHGTNPGSRTKISMGTRAHTPGSASTARLSSAPRSALRAALRGDRTPSLALDRNEVVRNKPGHLGQQLHLGGLDRARLHR